VQQLGSLAVTITPQGAIDAGAKWRRTGTSTWLNSGTTETGIPVGPYTVEFSDIVGWTKPANQPVTISNGQTANTSGTYVQQLGSLAVTITPQGAIDAGPSGVVREQALGLTAGPRRQEFRSVHTR